MHFCESMCHQWHIVYIYAKLRILVMSWYVYCAWTSECVSCVWHQTLCRCLYSSVSIHVESINRQSEYCVCERVRFHGRVGKTKDEQCSEKRKLKIQCVRSTVCHLLSNVVDDAMCIRKTTRCQSNVDVSSRCELNVHEIWIRIVERRPVTHIFSVTHAIAFPSDCDDDDSIQCIGLLIFRLASDDWAMPKRISVRHRRHRRFSLFDFLQSVNIRIFELCGIWCQVHANQLRTSFNRQIALTSNFSFVSCMYIPIIDTSSVVANDAEIVYFECLHSIARFIYPFNAIQHSHLWATTETSSFSKL